MRVIIAGGSGLIGSALTQHLCARGHAVVVLSRQPYRVSGLPDGAEVAGWDGSSSEGWEEQVEEADAIVNLAGESIAARRWSYAQKRRLRDSRIHSTNAVAAAVRAAARKPSVLIQASAVGYYGNTGDREVDEQSPPGADFLADLSQEWERAAAPVEESGSRLVLLRLGLALSAEGGVLPRVALPFRFFAGGSLGSGQQWAPWIHIDDVTRAIEFSMTSADVAGPVNLCAPEPARYADFARAVGRALGRPSFMRVPSWALRLAMGEMADLVVHGQRTLPRRLAEAGYEFRYPTLEESLDDLLGG